MRIVTLAMFVKYGKILLGMKKRGFGAGKWNGYGGKLNDGESPEQAVVREIQEESGIIVPEQNLIKLGCINFYFDDKPEFNQRVIIYRVDSFEGEPIETEEMKPEWFDIEKPPFESMWIDDPLWYPYFLREEKFSGNIHFADEGKSIASSDIKPE